MSTERKLPGGLRTVFRLHAVAVVLAATPLVLVPNLWAELVRWGTVDVTLARLLGGAFLATAVGSYLASRARTYGDVRVYLLFEQSIGTILVLVAAYEVLLAGAPQFTWAVVAIAGVFSLARGYYLVRAAEFEPAPGQPVP
jgi:O-antigen/teichoic acid export membrane protein